MSASRLLMLQAVNSMCHKSHVSDVIEQVLGVLWSPECPVSSLWFQRLYSAARCLPNKLSKWSQACRSGDMLCVWEKSANVQIMVEFRWPLRRRCG